MILDSKGKVTRGDSGKQEVRTFLLPIPSLEEPSPSLLMNMEEAPSTTPHENEGDLEEITTSPMLETNHDGLPIVL